MIVFDHVSKVYPNGTVGLDDVNLTIQDGEFVAIIGRSGAGKTTLFRILTGQEEADSGQVIIPAGKRLGLISQIPVYPAGYTVEDVLLELCDRIVVLCGGQVSGVVDARTTDKRQIGALMTLVNKGGKADE